MLSQWLQRTDTQFAQTALSAEKRAAKLSSLRQSRTISFIVCTCLFFAVLVDFTLHRSISSLLLFILVVNLFVSQGVVTQILILEVFKKMQDEAAGKA
jgi:hypothetical protein